MSPQPRPRFGPAAAGQRGQALILALLIVGAAIAALVYFLATPAKLKLERDRKTAAALAQAKAALIGFAASVDITVDCPGPDCPRLGDLPCPDLDNNGTVDVGTDTPCGTVGTDRLGRLPWKSLGLPDVRDGDGERLWYAVSGNAKNSPRTSCAPPVPAGCLNSDSSGTITVRDRNGAVIQSGAIAVIIAPGAVLRRQGAASAQDRGAVGVNTASNYLDVSGAYDNAASAANAFINGDIFDAAGNPIVNDRVLAITTADLMPLLQRRVAKEALNCLEAYAIDGKNKGRYPWASSMSASSGSDPYPDSSGVRYGRIPDPPLWNTVQTSPWSIKNCAPPTPLPPCMSETYPASCSLIKGTWWKNWKDLVLYGVAEAYRPDFDDKGPGVNPGGPCVSGSGNCLTVNPPSPSDDKRIVVFVAGKRLTAVASGQPRTSAADRSEAANYAEGQNNNDETSPDTFYEQSPATATFNDVLLYR